MNERDSEAVAAQLAARGYTLAATEAEAEVILLNTCSVRDDAEQKALNKMRNLVLERKRHEPGLKLGFMGCMAQSRGASLVERQPEVDLVLGTQKFHQAAGHLDDLLSGKVRQVVDTAAESGSEGMVREHLAQGEVTSFVSIMQGCNQHCTFCIVPQTRGAERSRSIEEIVAEVRGLVAQGVREVTLLGQIVTSYGRREIPVKDGRTPFVQLLEAVHGIDGLERVRFTAPHPKGYGDDLVEAYGRLPKLVESAHIPMQSGSDRILKLMHRGYTRERFLEIIGKLRRVRPDMGILTDLIVGFPGETEEDFAATEALVREAEFDQVYLFKYSPRKDTPAAAMAEQVPAEVREERHARLLGIINEIAGRRYARLVGRTVEILVEGPSKRNSARMMGRTRCNKIVVYEGAGRQRGQLVELKITRAGSFTLYGIPPEAG